MCSCDVNSLNLGLCFAVSGSGQLWWLSRYQLFRACLDSAWFLFSALFSCSYLIWFSVCFEFSLFVLGLVFAGVLEGDSVKFSLIWYLPFPPTVAASLWCRDSVLSWVQGKCEGGNQVKWMPNALWVFDAHACVAEKLSCTCLFVARLRIASRSL